MGKACSKHRFCCGVTVSIRLLMSALLLSVSPFVMAKPLATEQIVAEQSDLEKSVMENLLLQAEAKQLADEAKWKHLLHYYEPVMGGALRSYVDDDKFFLAEQGKYQPEQELEATIRAFYQKIEDSNEHAICVFPARFEWLDSHLNLIEKDLILPDCSDYKAWREKVNATRLSLIFPSAYINSPSSMFGHTLFRFDPENVEEGSDWLSWSLSFGADLDASDNSIAFAYKGIFGGYPGIYTMMHYFEKIKEYNHLENRDIWEYELDVNSQGVHEMLSHTWELKNMLFDYYFLDENCAFRLLEQIELARNDVQLTNQFDFTAIPSNTVRSIADGGLIKSAKFKPSATTRLKSRIAELSEQEQIIARALADDIEILESSDYLNLSPERQAKISQVAYSYLRYIQLKKVRDPEIAGRSHRLLSVINRLPSQEHDVLIPERPENGHKTEFLGVSMGLEDDEAFAQLNYRATYHDLLDNPTGYPQGAHIVMGNTQVRLTDSNVSFERFDFIHIISLSEMDRFFNSPSWHVKTGYERIWMNDEDGALKRAGATYVKAGFGASLRLGEDYLAYGFADARLEHNKHYEPFMNIAPGLSAGILSYQDWGTSQLKVASEYLVEQDEYRVTGTLEQNIQLGINDALRLGYSHQWHRGSKPYEVSLEYRHFF